MSTAAGLLAAIQHSGDDRLPWLVFCDWIEDRGFTEDAQRLRECRWHAIDPTHLLSPDARCAVIAGGECPEEELRLQDEYSPLTDRGLIALATVRAPRLRVLDVSYSEVTDAGVLAVVRAAGLAALRFLNLRGIRLSDETVAELHRSPVSFVRGPDRDSYDECCCRDCRRRDVHDLDDDGWALTPDRPDRHARLGHPGWSRHRWWGGFQVSQLCKRRRLAR